MKNTRLKNVIFTAGMAVFTGVLLLGVNAAIGAATPTVDPPGAGVSPTFTGLNVNGNIQNSAGNVSVSDNLAVTGNVDVSGALSADSLITPTISDGSNAVVINDGLVVNGPGASRIDGTFVNVNAILRANNSIVNAANGGAAPVTVNDNFVVTGTSNLQGNVTFDGNIASDEDTLLVNDMLRVGGGLIIDGPQSRFDGEFINVNAILRANNGIINASSAPAPVTVNDNFVVTGTSDLRGNVSDSTGSFTVGDNFVVTGTSDLRGNISDSTATEVTINDGLTVTGAAKASRFGTYTRTSEIFTMSPAEGISWKYFSKACPAGQILVSCGGGSNWGALTFGELYPGDNNTCYLTIHRDNTGYFAYADIVTMCLDPDA